MHKRLIFFDGDGTLWYPKLTKRTRKPHWIYHDSSTKNDYLQHLELTPGTEDTLRQLHGRGLQLVVISASPHPEAQALADLKQRLDYFGLTELLHTYLASDGSLPGDKGRLMRGVIDELGCTPADALMVGDSYRYDYQPAQSNGITALFIENSVAELPETKPADFGAIKEVSDLLTLLD